MTAPVLGMFDIDRKKKHLPDHNWDRFQHPPQPLQPKTIERSSLFMNAAPKGVFITLRTRAGTGTISSSYLSHHRKQNFSISLSISSLITVAFDGLLMMEAPPLWDSAHASIERTEQHFWHRLPLPISGPCHRWWPLCCSFNRMTSGTSCSLSAPVNCWWVD